MSTPKQDTHKNQDLEKGENRQPAARPDDEGVSAKPKPIPGEKDTAFERSRPGTDGVYAVPQSEPNK